MRSMTSFGRAKLEKERREYLVEIRSVNHKYTDITVKVPKNLLFLEDKIRKTVLNRIARGKIEIYITYINNGLEGKNVILNNELANFYIKKLNELASLNNIPDGIGAMEILKMPDVLNIQIEESSLEIIWNELSECLENALDNFIDMRSIEGNKIKLDIEKRLDRIKQNIEEICKNSAGLIEEYVVKLEDRIKEILKTDILDKTRLSQEVVIYADKCSIEEEITRLNSHIYQMKEIIQTDEAIGKKMDFIVQEMNREINTIGSKSGSLVITNLVIDTKTILEDIREQIQNIE